MKPGSLMLLGAVSAAVAAAVVVSGRVDGGVMLFAAGALFGKGYGVWEERSRRAALEKETRE